MIGGDNIILFLDSLNVQSSESLYKHLRNLEILQNTVIEKISVDAYILL